MPFTDEGKRLVERVRERFRERFGVDSRFVARAPGRVNLIGEHVDYEGYAVLPSAISLDVVIAFEAVSPSEGITIANLDAERYSEKHAASDPASLLDKAKLGWATYFMCGYIGIFEWLGSEAPQPMGLRAMVGGRVPQGSGLSSSSALVCASAIAAQHVLGVSLPPEELAELCAKAERHAGAESGGMDQAISFLAEMGYAKLVRFNPVRAESVGLPDEVRIIVANSLAESHKAATAASRYNLRVLECLFAAKILARLGGTDPQFVTTLKDAQESIGKDAKQMAELAESSLRLAPYNMEELEMALGVPPIECIKDKPALAEALESNAEGSGLKLRDRAMHVFRESSRVEEFKEAAKAGDVGRMGALLNESHASLRDQYNCSCRELDELVSRLLEGGAIGARLTGAGWGGCAVALAMENKLEGVLSHVRNTFFAMIDDARLSSVLFSSRPAKGALLMRSSS